MFPVMYEMDFYIPFKRISVFKGLKTSGCSIHLIQLHRNIRNRYHCFKITYGTYHVVAN
jgi:hypothetical protein